MDVQPYGDLSDLNLLALCCYREARGEHDFDAKRGVCHVIRNRTLKPGWWGHDWASVILKPWQFSSFNQSDVNSGVWPTDETNLAWIDCLAAASGVYDGTDVDLTNDATYYHDVSISWPKSWGNELLYENTLNVGRLKFYRLL